MSKLLEGRRLIFFDFEVLSNCIVPETNEPYWSVVFIEKESGKGRLIKNDREALRKFHKQCENDIFIGYNSRSYDQWIFKGLLLGYCPGKLTKQLIEDGIKGHNLISKHWRVKLLTYDAINKFNSLKQLEAFMGSEIRESSIPFDIDRIISLEEELELNRYCAHDVRELIKVFNINIGTFNSHIALMEMFNLDITNISKTQAQLNAVILEATKIDNQDDEFEFIYPDTVNLGRYGEVKEWFDSIKNGEIKVNGKVELELKLAGTDAIYALGGLHSGLPNYIRKGKIYSIDVNSLYPSLILEYGLMSRGVVSDVKFREIRDKRFKYKKEGNPLEAVLKLILNSTYGVLGDQYNALCDKRMMRSVCVTGQLLLTDLVDKIEDYCEPFNINTDGIFFYLENEDNLKLIEEACKEWENRTRLGLGWEEYKMVIQKDVNNLIAVSTNPNGKHKTIGAFVKKQTKLDYDLPIVNKAVKNYFMLGISPEQTILPENKLIEFQKIVKVTSAYDLGALYGATFSKQPVYNEKTGKFTKKMMWDEGSGEYLKDKTFRVFASSRDSDGGLYKQKSNKNPEKFSNTSENVFIDNGNIVDKEVPEYLDKQWYIELSYDRIRQFLGLDKKKFKKEDLKNYEFTS